MKVSCVIITHNRISYLKRAVNSVVNQIYKNIEIFVIDDASEDGTEAYGEELNKIGINYIRINKKDSKGGNYARNLGIQHSTGEYVAFLDDDDYWLPDKIEKQVKYAEKHPDVGMIYGGLSYEFGNSLLNYKSLPNPDYQGNMIEKGLYIAPFASTITLFVKRSLLKEIGGFDENMRYWQEYELEIRLMQKTLVGFVPDIVAVANRCGTVKRLTSQYDNWEKSVDYLNKKHEQLFSKLSDDMKKRKQEYYYREAAYRVSAVGDKKRMKEFYKKANAINPKIEYKVRSILGLSKENTIFLESCIRRVIYMRTKRVYRSQKEI